MEAIKKEITFKKLIEVKNAIVYMNYQKKNRLSLSIWQLGEYMKYPFEQYNKKVLLLNQKLCSTDKDGNFYLDENGNPLYTKFSREKALEREVEYKKLKDETVEMEVKYCQDFNVIKELELTFLQVFNGFLFDVTQDQIEKWHMGEEPAKGEVSKARK